MDFNAWLHEGSAIAAEPRAALAWRRIQDKPTEVSFKKPNGTVLSAQTVRLEMSDAASETASPSGTQTMRQVIVFGVRDHAYITDTDVASGYRFVLNSKEYQVRDVVETLGEVQARAEVVS